MSFTVGQRVRDRSNPRHEFIVRNTFPTTEDGLQVEVATVRTPILVFSASVRHFERSPSPLEEARESLERSKA